jgi:hypothetical protein
LVFKLTRPNINPVLFGKKFWSVQISYYSSLNLSIQVENGKDYWSRMTLNDAEWLYLFKVFFKKKKLSIKHCSTPKISLKHHLTIKNLFKYHLTPKNLIQVSFKYQEKCEIL